MLQGSGCTRQTLRTKGFKFVATSHACGEFADQGVETKPVALQSLHKAGIIKALHRTAQWRRPPGLCFVRESGQKAEARDWYRR
jgi:hypothetical protein